MNYSRTLRSLFWVGLCLLAAVPVAAVAAAPGDAAAPQTGEVTLKFTRRSPLSSRKELARRISCKESELGDDYDITTFRFRAYIPRNYDPSTAYGVFVYLGNHDVNTVATKWEPLFDKSHMIYITNDWHSPMPEWQLVGLGFDAVDNLKRLYNIDTQRLYDMWFNSGSLQMSIAGADVYTGMIVGEDWHYFRRINLPANHFVDADMPRPPDDLLDKAKLHGAVMIGLAPPDEGLGVVTKAMKEDGFDHVLGISEAYDELHYPNYAVSWISDPVLPFLDKFSKESAAVAGSLPLRESFSADSGVKQNAATPATLPSGTSSSAAAGNSDAQHLLNMARLYIDNGDTERGRGNLQTILSKYPGDPAAIPAKKLLDSLPPSGAPGQ